MFLLKLCGLCNSPTVSSIMVFSLWALLVCDASSSDYVTMTERALFAPSRLVRGRGTFRSCRRSFSCTVQAVAFGRLWNKYVRVIPGASVLYKSNSSADRRFYSRESDTILCHNDLALFQEFVFNRAPYSVAVAREACSA